MKQKLNLIKCVLVSLVIVKSISIFGQSDIRFSYECKDDIITPVKTRILLKFPDESIFNLLIDTVTKYNYSEKFFFKSNGKYTLSVWFETEKNCKDSIDYEFELNGSEINTEISVKFRYKNRYIKERTIYVEGEKVLNGYIQIEKYYNASKLIDIKFDKEILGNEFYTGPFFKIKNNSKDTLYGEHLPGYFWGTLSYLRNDSVFFTRIGTLDYNFVNSPPLYPDSTKYATIGSFGITNKLAPFEYRFEVMLVKGKWESKGVGIYKELQDFVWWAGMKEYYKLKYDFKIDDQTPKR